MKVIIEYPVEHPIEVSVKVYEEHAFIAIKKYGDAYKKLRERGFYSLPNNPSNIEEINSEERCNTMKIGDIANNVYHGRYHIFINKIFHDERCKYNEEQLEIARTEALKAMKKANLFDKLFVDNFELLNM